MTQERLPEREPDFLAEQLHEALELQVRGSWQASVDAYTGLEQQFGGDARIYNGRGVAWRMLRNPAAAIADYTKAREIADREMLLDEALTAEVGLIDAYRTANRDPHFNPWSEVAPEDLQSRLHQEAQVHMAEARAVLGRISGTNLAKVNALTNFGLLHNDMGNLGPALDVYIASEAMIRELVASTPENIDFQNRLARVLTTKGVTQDRLGMLDEAEHSQREALDMYQTLGDLRGIGNARVSLGDVLRKNDRLPEAQRYYDQALVGVMREGKIIDPEVYANATNRLAQLL